MAKTSKSKFKKAPQAPRRFKSAYMFFSETKHKEIRAGLGTKGKKEKATNIAKIVSKEWKALSAEERGKYEEMARKDKKRFELEKSIYTGPWKVLAKKSERDPEAPKRPMSAFFAYSLAKRPSVRLENNNMSRVEISRFLANMWKEAPEDERKQYIEQEQKLRKDYHSKIAIWREKNDDELANQRRNREAMVLKSVEGKGAPGSQTEAEQQAIGDQGTEAVGYSQVYPRSIAPQSYGGSSLPPLAQGQMYRGAPPLYPPPPLPPQYYLQTSTEASMPAQAGMEGGYARYPAPDGYPYESPNYGYHLPPAAHPYPIQERRSHKPEGYNWSHGANAYPMQQLHYHPPEGYNLNNGDPNLQHGHDYVGTGNSAPSQKFNK